MGTGGREGGREGGRIGVAVFSVAQHTHAHRLYGKVSAHRSIGTSRRIARILHPACVLVLLQPPFCRAIHDRDASQERERKKTVTRQPQPQP